MSPASVDVAIVGGGLAGLTLAVQLKREIGNALDIAVIERHRHPVPLAAHKVGESTVEIGARYLAEQVGLREHLEGEHLPKFGLRFFFGGEAQRGDLATLDEVGASDLLPVRSYQVDRGVLENHLGETARAAGVQFLDGCTVTAARLGQAGGPHELTWRDDGRQRQLRARWLVDAGSRAGPLRAALGIREPSAHANHAVWFRVPGHVRVDDWSAASTWQNRVAGPGRWLSTNHFMGPGYWVWLIPLGSGATSVGIVADPALHPPSAMPDLDATFEWLSRWQPLCFDALRPLRGSVMDFRFLRRYSHGARRVFSADRWAMTGEAGVFLDPFYSPGSDFIGISNGFITELVRRDLQGKPDAGRSRMLEELYLSFYRSCLDLYLDQYPGFGDLRLMACKTTWDYAYYWGVLARLYFAGALADEGLLQSAGPGLLRARRLNQHLQEGFRQRAAGRRSEAPAGRFVDQCAIPCLRDLNAALPGPADGAALSLELDRNLGLLHRLADALTGLLEEGAPPDPGRERALVGDLRSRLAA